MNSRERLLLITIVLFGVGMIGIYAYTSMTAAVAQRKTNLETIENQIAQQQITMRSGANATRNIAKLQERSLPADKQQAGSMYQTWLLDLVESSGLRNSSVIPTTRNARAGFYSPLSFKIDGEANLEEVVALLHGFYSSNDLHRINRLTLKPIPSSESRMLDVAATVEAIILPNNKRTEVGNLPSDRLGDVTLSDYREAILNRNAFSDPNEAPKMAVVSDKTAYRDERFTLEVSADDNDERDTLSFRLEGDVPEGMEIDEKDGTLKWYPEENGEFEVRVAVVDDGTPSLSDYIDFTITVKDPPVRVADDNDDEPKKPEFDEAEFAYVIGTVSNGPNQEIWLKIRTTGKLLRLSIGDRVSVGTVDGVIDQIGDKDVLIRTDDGDLRIRVGQSLKAAA